MVRETVRETVREVEPSLQEDNMTEFTVKVSYSADRSEFRKDSNDFS